LCTQVAWYIFFLVSPLSSNKAIRWFPSFLVASASFSCNSQFKFTNNKLLALKLQLMKLNCQIMLFMYQTSIALISGYHCRPSNVFIYVLIFISSDQKDERAKIGHLLREWRSFSPPPPYKSVSHYTLALPFLLLFNVSISLSCPQMTKSRHAFLLQKGSKSWVTVALHIFTRLWPWAPEGWGESQHQQS